MAESTTEQSPKRDPMRIDTEQSKVILNWLERHWQDKHCPICHHEQWDVARHMTAGNLYNRNRMAVGTSQVYPVVMVFCKNCGHIHLFAAVKIPGLLNVKEKADG